MRQKKSMADPKPDPKELADTGGIVGSPGTEKHPRPPADVVKSKGGRPSKQPDDLKEKPTGAAETDPHKILAERKAAYEHRKKNKTGKEIKTDAREARRKARFLEKGY